MSVWTLFNMTKGLHWIGAHDAKTMAQVLINGQLCKGEVLIGLLTNILKYQGADPDITFKDFAEYFGTDLQVVASDLTANEVRLLNSHTSPDLPVAIGVAMSSSYPFLFPTIEWKEEWRLYNQTVNLTGHLMSDGGLISNFPIRYLISNEPPVLALRGGKIFNIHKTIFLGVYEEMDANLSPEQQAVVDTIYSIQVPPCGIKLFKWNKWGLFHFFSSVIDKIQSSIHTVAQMAGICSHNQEGPSSWEDVLSQVEDLPGLKTIFSLLTTLTTFEENLYTSHFTDQIVTASTKGLQQRSVNFSEQDVKPYSSQCYKAVSQTLEEILK